MKTFGFKSLIILSAVAVFCNCRNGIEQPDYAVLFNVEPSLKNQCEQLLFEGAGQYVKNGVLLDTPEKLFRLDRYYALAEREGRYIIVPSADAVIKFSAVEDLHYTCRNSSFGVKEDFKAILDVPSKLLRICSSPEEIVVEVPFIEGGREYAVEVINCYQQSIVIVTDTKNGKSAKVSGVHDGIGGEGRGKVQEGFNVGMHRDNYAVTLMSGKDVLIKRLTVYSLKDDVQAIIYGASISQPEAYFPTKDFHRSWTQQVIAKMDGNAMSSGRGGCNIDDVTMYMHNELPYIKTKYVMLCIGTNGGNTEEKLDSLLDFIESCGAIPILSNVPCNESGTQVPLNELISKVREKRGLNGCHFDLATSLDGDGKEVDKSLMYWEDYLGHPVLDPWQIYHHPNVLGGDAMFQRTLIDIPEVYEIDKK